MKGKLCHIRKFVFCTTIGVMIAGSSCMTVMKGLPFRNYPESGLVWSVENKSGNLSPDVLRLLSTRLVEPDATCSVSNTYKYSNKTIDVLLRLRPSVGDWVVARHLDKIETARASQALCWMLVTGRSLEESCNVTWYQEGSKWSPMMDNDGSMGALARRQSAFIEHAKMCAIACSDFEIDGIEAMIHSMSSGELSARHVFYDEWRMKWESKKPVSWNEWGKQIDFLEQCARSSVPVARRHGIRWLCWLGVHDSVEYLLPLLGDKDAALRVFAAQQLAFLAPEIAVAECCRMATSDNAMKRQQAVDGLYTVLLCFGVAPIMTLKESVCGADIRLPLKLSSCVDALSQLANDGDEWTRVRSALALLFWLNDSSLVFESQSPEQSQERLVLFRRSDSDMSSWLRTDHWRDGAMGSNVVLRILEWRAKNSETEQDCLLAEAAVGYMRWRVRSNCSGSRVRNMFDGQKKGDPELWALSNEGMVEGELPVVLTNTSHVEIALDTLEWARSPVEICHGFDLVSLLRDRCGQDDLRRIRQVATDPLRGRKRRFEALVALSEVDIERKNMWLTPDGENIIRWMLTDGWRDSPWGMYQRAIACRTATLCGMSLKGVLGRGTSSDTFVDRYINMMRVVHGEESEDRSLSDVAVVAEQELRMWPFLRRVKYSRIRAAEGNSLPPSP